MGCGESKHAVTTADTIIHRKKSNKNCKKDVETVPETSLNKDDITTNANVQEQESKNLDRDLVSGAPVVEVKNVAENTKPEVKSGGKEISKENKEGGNPKPETAKTKTAIAENAKTETAKTETAKPENAKTETAKTEIAKTETAKPETAKSETANTETAKTETAEPETAEPETAEPAESENAEPAEPETAEPENANTEVKGNDKGKSGTEVSKDEEEIDEVVSEGLSGNLKVEVNTTTEEKKPAEETNPENKIEEAVTEKEKELTKEPEAPNSDVEAKVSSPSEI